MTPANKDDNALESQEKAVFVACENSLLNYRQAPFEAGQAMQRIRDGRLYREFFPNFAAYCEERWTFSRSTADRLIGAHMVYELLAPIGVVLESESQARCLIGLANDEIIAAGKLALTISGGKRLTAKHFQIAAEQLRPRRRNNPVISKSFPASAKSVATVLALVSAAEAAAKEGNHKAVLDALAAIKTCLMPSASSAVPEQEPGSKESAGASIPSKSPGSRSAVAAVEPGHGNPAAPNGEAAPVETCVTGHTSDAPGDTVAAKPARRLPAVNGSDSSKNGTDRPARVLVASTETPITRWNEVPILVANWLLAQGHNLPGIACIKRNPSDFAASARIRQLQGDWYMDIGDGQHKLLRNARLLLDRSGHRDVPLAVKLTNGHTLAV